MANEENIKKHQFKKGQSGNPAGSPVGAFSRSSIAKRWLETLEKSKNPITGLYEDLTQEDIMTLAVLKKARQGDVRAYDALMNSVYGKPKESKDITVNEEPRLFPNLTYDDI